MKQLAVVVLVACAHTVPAPAPAADAGARAAAVSPGAVSPGPPWVGIGFAPDTRRITRIIPDAPAARAGLRVGDELIALDGVAIVDSAQVVRSVATSKTGAIMTIVALRDGQPRRFAVTLTPRPDPVGMLQTLVGKPAPRFAAPVVSGPYSATLADLAGHVVVLDFWATWCGPCAITLPRLAELHARYAAKGLRIVGISDEATDVIAAFVTEHKLAYTIARDPDGAIASDYLVQGVPMLVVIDRAGVIRHIGLGADDVDEAEAVIVKLLE